MKPELAYPVLGFNKKYKRKELGFDADLRAHLVMQGLDY